MAKLWTAAKIPEVAIKLKNTLALVYALFTSLVLLALVVIVNLFAGKMFEKFVRAAINERSAEIVRAVSELYDPADALFDIPRLETIGMLFVHEGYVIDVENGAGVVWDAREMDMRHCVDALQEISARMESRYGLRGELQNISYPVVYADNIVGKVNIATYGPFFYGENESEFLSSLNTILAALAVLFILVAAALSLPLAVSISRPVARAGEAARHIANGNLAVRLDETAPAEELAGLARSINEMAAALEKAERRQKQITADIAHELRTPLACLQGGIEAMLDGVWEITPGRLQGCAEEVRRLTKLIDDLALLSSLEWDHIQPRKTTFAVEPFFRLVCDSFIPAAAEKNLVIRCDTATLSPGSVMTADYDRLKQVMLNLLANAVKYTNEGSITVSARLLGENGPWEITVADTGMGIHSADLPHIFDRFFRSDKSRSRNTGGHGLGLAIAHAIIKAHGGAITAENAPVGTLFRIRLP